MEAPGPAPGPAPAPGPIRRFPPAQEELQAQARALRDRRERMLRLKAAEEEKSLDLLERVGAERERLRGRVRELRELLAGQERLLLARLAGLERAVLRRRERSLGRLSERIAALGLHIRRLEETCEQPPWELLQDSTDILGRLETESDPEPGETPPEPAEEPPEPAEEHPEPAEEPLEPAEEHPEPAEEPPEPAEEPPEPAEEHPEPAEEPLEPAEEHPEPAEEPLEPAEEPPEPAEEHPEPAEEPLEPAEEHPEPAEEHPEPAEEPLEAPQKSATLREMLQKFRASVTLDPDTAHPRLALSEDLKRVRWDQTRSAVPAHPKRFDSSRCVLGQQRFSSGRHYWEVRVSPGAAWALGVARDSVPRKGRLRVRPERGVWAVGQCGSSLQALASPSVALALAEPPEVLGVLLDCEAGRVAFLEARTGAPLFAFPAASFRGAAVLPLLCLGRGCELELSP